MWRSDEANTDTLFITSAWTVLLKRGGGWKTLQYLCHREHSETNSEAPPSDTHHSTGPDLLSGCPIQGCLNAWQNSIRPSKISWGPSVRATLRQGPWISPLCPLMHSLMTTTTESTEFQGLGRHLPSSINSSIILKGLQRVWHTGTRRQQASLTT